jgi:rRNA maturation RNase YbeY
MSSPPGVVTVRLRGGRGRTLATGLATRAVTALRVLRLGGAELSLVLVDDAEIRVLNGRYRGKDRATDVLSFPMHGRHSPAAGPWLLGDVVISLDTARRQAAAQGCRLMDAAERLLIHGLLHLLGYDHEVSAREAQRMARRERFVARALQRAGETRSG